jgi:dihydrofolate synthase / folylpolyglutamate synthase
VAILEVGLGGRLDAVNIMDADCTIITSIDIDHTAILGHDRDTIGFEKAGVMRAGRPVIVSDPVPPQSVIDHATALGAELWLFGRDFNYSGDKQQWAWAGRDRRYSGMAYPALRGANQLINASGVLAALEALRQRIPVTAQAVRNGWPWWSCPAAFRSCLGSLFWCWMWPTTRTRWRAGCQPGRHGFLPHHPRRAGGHGRQGPVAHAAKASTRWWTVGISPICLCPCRQSVRFAAAFGKAKTPGSTRPAVCTPTPLQALQAAIDAADPADRIVVFGSFYTVGGVLQDGIPRCKPNTSALSTCHGVFQVPFSGSNGLIPSLGRNGPWIGRKHRVGASTRPPSPDRCRGFGFVGRGGLSIVV